MIYKYLISCKICDDDVFCWGIELPTECPNNAGHEIGDVVIVNVLHEYTEEMYENCKNKIKQKKEPIDVKSESDDFQCMTCMDMKRCMLFTPCMHINSCIKCSKRHISCPECRQDIQESKHVFIN